MRPYSSINLLILSLAAFSSAFSPSFNSVSSTPTMLNRFSRGIINNRHLHTTLSMARKAGVSEPEDLKSFVEKAGDKLLVVDVRNPDASAEPGDQKSIAVAALPSEAFRPSAVSLIYDRETSSMPLPDVDKDTPIITHCGGGGRGQKAKDYLEENGFTNILNGGGPKETDCWAEFGDN